MSQSSDVILPTGTVYLLQEKRSTERKTLILEPTPSKDPNEPLNWSKFRKTVNYTLVLALSLTIFTALSVQIIFWQFLAIEFRATFQQLNNAQSCNAAGMTAGAILFIPLAVKYGRRPIYIVSTAIIFAMMVWSSRMKTVTEMYLTNLILGLASATNEAIVGMTVADLYFVHQRGTMNGLYLVMVMTGSFLTPMIAGVQATAQGWRWSYYLLSLFTGLMLLLFIFFYEETKYVPTIMGDVPSTAETDVGISGKNDSVDVVKSLGEGDIDANEDRARHLDSSIPLKTWGQRHPLITSTPVPIVPLVYRPIVALFSFPAITFAALQYGAGLCWIINLSATVSEIFSYPPYNFKPSSIGYMGVAPFIGNLIGSIYCGPLADRAIIWFAKRNKGYYEPEMRLYLLHLPSLTMAGGIIMFGVTTAREMHWIYPAVGSAFFGFGLGAFGDTVLTLVMDSYRDITGEAFVGITIIRNLFSIIMGLVRVQWMMGMGLKNAYILMGCISLAISLLYIPMIIFGKWFRTRLAGKYHRMAEMNRRRD